jgi:hypothetical protein
VDNDGVGAWDFFGLTIEKTNINCIGHACSFGGGFQPRKSSLEKELKKAGWNCIKIKNSSECKPSCKEEEVAVVYIYITKGKSMRIWNKMTEEQKQKRIQNIKDSQKNKGRKKPEDFWKAENFWNSRTNRKGIDFHGIKYNPQKGSSSDWEYVGNNRAKRPKGTFRGKDSRDEGRYKIDGRLNDPDDYWKNNYPERVLGAYCCKKCK